MKKFSAILSLSILAALPMQSAFADPGAGMIFFAKHLNMLRPEDMSAKQRAELLALLEEASRRDEEIVRLALSPMQVELAPTPTPLEKLIQWVKGMPTDQKIREGTMALTLPGGPLLALIDAYAVEKSEQKKIEIKAKFEDFMKKHHLGKYAAGEMMMKPKPVGAYLYASRSLKRLPAEAILSAKDAKNGKKVQETKIAKKSI